MFCIYCGTSNPEGAKYCHKCGRYIGGVNSASPVWPPVGIDARMEYEEQKEFSQKKPEKNEIPKHELQKQPAKPVSHEPPVEKQINFSDAERQATEKPAQVIREPIRENRQNPPEQVVEREAPPAAQSELIDERPARKTSTPADNPWGRKQGPESKDTDPASQDDGYPDEYDEPDVNADSPENTIGWDDDDENIQFRKPSLWERIKNKREVKIAIVGIGICIIVILFALNNLLHFIRF